MNTMGGKLVTGICVSAVFGVFLLGAPAHAANKKDPNKEALRRMQMQVKQAQDDKATAEGEKAALGQELAALKKKNSETELSMSRANSRRAAVEKELEAIKAEKSKLSEDLDQMNKKLGETQHDLDDTRQSLRQEASQRERAEQSLGMRTRELGSCETKNRKLYQYHVELINRAQSRGTLDTLLELEPLTQIQRVEIENLLEEYRDKVDTERVEPTLGARRESEPATP